MVWNSQCRAGHINTYRDPSVSAFQVLELKVYTTTPNFLSKFLIKKNPDYEEVKEYYQNILMKMVKNKFKKQK